LNPTASSINRQTIFHVRVGSWYVSSTVIDPYGECEQYTMTRYASEAKWFYGTARANVIANLVGGEVIVADSRATNS
jgi:hypothetical protein